MDAISDVLEESKSDNLNSVLKKIYYYLSAEAFDIDFFDEFIEVKFKISPYDSSGKEIEGMFKLMFSNDPTIESHHVFIENNMWIAHVRIYN